MSARFHIKVNPRGGVALRDRHAPAFVRSFPSIEEAAFAMDNRVRAEIGLRPRLRITRAEIREAMTGSSSQAGLASYSRTRSSYFPRDFDQDSVIDEKGTVIR